MNPLTEKQARKLARVWAGKLLIQCDAMGNPDPRIISEDDYEMVAAEVNRIGCRLMASSTTGKGDLDSIAKELFPNRQ